MAIIKNIVSKLTGTAQPGNWIVSGGEFEELKRQQHFQKLYDYYMGDRAQIARWMQKTMAKQFKAETIEKMQLPYRNIVKKIIHRTALAYKLPAERYVVEESANEAYQDLLNNSNINTQAKEWNRLAKLMDTVYVAPMWRNDHIEFDLFPSHLISVKISKENYLEPEMVMYEEVRGDEVVKVYWSKDEFYETDKHGKRLESKAGGLNPYGLLPFIPCRLRSTEDHWGEGDSQLVDINEQANILLASTFHNAIMQSHGIPVGINLGLDKGEQLITGPDKMIKVEGVREGQIVPQLFFAQPTPATEACLLLIDELYKTAAVDRGLPASSVSKEEITQSGAAKEIDNIELMEIRQDDIEALRLFEKKLFQATIAVWNHHTTGRKIPETSTFICDFAEITMPKTVEEEVKEKEFGWAHGLWTPVDDLIDEDEGVDEVAAMKIIEHNLELKKKIQGVNNAGRETNLHNGGDQQYQLGIEADTGGEVVQGRAAE